MTLALECDVSMEREIVEGSALSRNLQHHWDRARRPERFGSPLSVQINGSSMARSIWMCARCPLRGRCGMRGPVSCGHAGERGTPDSGALSGGERGLETARPGESFVKVLEVVFISAIFAIGAAAQAASSPLDVNAFADASYIYIATVRKDGSQSRSTPVWFVTTGQGQILIDTNTDSWKAKRIRRGSPVIVWMGSRTGLAFIGKAEFVTDRSVHDPMTERIPH